MNESYKQNFIKAGAIASEVRDFGKSCIQKGASYNECILKIKAKIASLGAIPAFPPQIALNHVAAHFLPSPGEDIIFCDEVVKLDVGVCYLGAIGDCATTIDLSNNNTTLVTAAEKALMTAQENIEVGMPVSMIGEIIEKTILSFGHKPIKNLGGHGLGLYRIHTPPAIPNYNDHSATTLKKGMTFAIEPFATTGEGLIYEEGKPMIFAVASNKPKLRNPAEKELFQKALSFKNLPFSMHDIADDTMPLPFFIYLLKSLVLQQALHAYPPLIEKQKGLVAQAENSVLIDQNGQIFITTK